MLKSKKSFGIEIESQLSDDFQKHCDESGYKKYRAIEGALRAFMVIPPKAQKALMSNTKDARGLMIKTFADIALEEDLQQVSPNQRNQILALAREAAKALSRKK